MYLHFIFTSILIFVMLLCTAVCCYRKCMLPFKGLPSVSILTVLKYLVFTRTPKNMTTASFTFQNVIQVCKDFWSEGVCYAWFINPTLIIFSEEAIKFFSNEEAALDKPSIYGAVEDSLGKGLITSNGDMWKKQRKTLNPLFYATALKGKVPIFNKHAATLVKELMEVPHDSVDIHKYLKLCTFSVIYETIIGIELHDKEGMGDVEHFIELVSEITDKLIEVAFRPWLQPIYNLNILPSGRQYFRKIQEIRDFIRKILLENLDSTQSRQNKIQSHEKENHRSFAQRLVELHLKDPTTFTMEYMLDEFLTIIAAGYDTVSYTLMFCLFLLGHHQDVQDKVYDELESVTSGDLSFEDLSELTYMECVIKESLRLYPTVPLHGRQLNKAVQFGKHNIPKGTVIVFLPYMYHRNPKIYPEPEKFDPERFSEENTEKRPWNHVPFSEGKRSCIGKKFALMELKIVLAHVIRHFKVTSLDRIEDIKLGWSIVLNTQEPLHLRLTPRKAAIQVQE